MLVLARLGAAAMPRGAFALREVCVVLGGLSFQVGPVFSGRLVAVQLFLVLLVGGVLGRIFLLALILEMEPC